MGPCSGKAADIQLSHLCLPQGKRHIAQEGHKGFLRAWKELVIATPPCKRAPRFSPSKIRGTRRVEGIWQLPMQERKSPSEPSGILTHCWKKQRASGTLPAGTEQMGVTDGHLLRQHQPRRLEKRWAAQRPPGLFPWQESRWDVVFGEGQEKRPHGCVSWARMGQSPRKELCVPTKAVPQGWAGLSDSIHPKKDLVLAFAGAKSSLCRRKGEVWVLHDSTPVWCTPWLQLGWVLGDLQPSPSRDFGLLS